MWNRRLELSRNKVIVRELAVGEVIYFEFLRFNLVHVQVPVTFYEINIQILVNICIYVVKTLF